MLRVSERGAEPRPIVIESPHPNHIWRGGVSKNKPQVRKYQQENMKNTIKATLIALAIAGVASSARATYSGDLLVGFTLQNGNDLVYDLGLAANLDWMSETWSLNSVLGSGQLRL